MRFGGRAAFMCQSMGLALVFGAQLVIARLLGSESYGVFAYVNAWLVVLGIGARCGLDTVALRDGGIMVARQDWSGVRELVGLAGRWMVSSGALLALVLVAGVLLVIPADQQELRTTFVIGAAVLPLQAVSSLRSSVLLALGKVWSGLGPDYLLRPTLLAAAVILWSATHSGHGAVVAIAATLVSTGIVLVVGQILLSRSLPFSNVSSSRKLVRSELLGSATTFLMFNGSSQLLYQVDTIIVGMMINPHIAGFYYVAKQLALVSSLALIALQTSAAPRIAALQADGKTSELQHLLGAIAWRGFLFSLAYLLGVVFVGRFVLAAFGEKFVAAYPALIALAVGQLCAAGVGAVGQMAAMAGLQLVGGVIYVISALCYAMAAVIVIPHFGVLGAAVTSAGITAAWNVVLCVLIAKKVGVSTAITSIRWSA